MNFAIRLRLSEDPNDNSLEWRRGWNAALREVDRIILGIGTTPPSAQSTNNAPAVEAQGEPAPFTRAAAPHSDAAQPSARETAFVSARGRCSCSHEAGDSKCEVHPTCEGCGIGLSESAVFTTGSDMLCVNCYRAHNGEPAIDLPEHDACDCEACRAVRDAACECTPENGEHRPHCPARGTT